VEPVGAADLPKLRPEHVPEKFWDPAASVVRTEALLKSYGELERKLGRMVPLPESELDTAAADRLLLALGRPASPDAYEIQVPNELVATDPAINAKLHAAGFTQKQAQLVYELAAERLLPVIEEATFEIEAAKQVERLQQRFGGERWPELARQLKTWAAVHLEPQTYQVLSSSYDGVIALHQMMRSAEPPLVDAAAADTSVSEAALDEMVRDPRYWRDRNPEFVARVTRGFKQLFAG
jgi:hypothetical protein